MSKIEDFKNAPVGATATHPYDGRAMKMGDVERRWIVPIGRHMDDEEMEGLGYTLEPSAPTTAREALDTVREALDLAWDLAHEVKPGQVIPKGTRFLEVSRSGVKEYIAHGDIKIRPELASITRTFDPLPDPEPELPDWHDAPAVIAVCNDTMDRDVFIRRGDGSWRSEFYGAETADLRDVTPLYPKEEEGEWVSL